MKLIFFTANDPLYLPAFFERVLGNARDSVSMVYIVPPLYRAQTPGAAAWRYLQTFGFCDFMRLGGRVAACKIMGRSIASVCSRFSAPCRIARDVNDPELVLEIERQAPDVIVSVSCPQIFKERVMSAARYGILNIHGALLPRYRGIMPSFWMMANGENTAGVSIYLVNDKIDAGDLCAQRSFAIANGESLDGFLRRSKGIAADLLLDVLRSMGRGRIACQPLAIDEGSYYSWPDRSDVRRFRERGYRVW